MRTRDKIDLNFCSIMSKLEPIIAQESNVNGNCGTPTVQKINDHREIRCTDISNDTSGISSGIYEYGCNKKIYIHSDI